MRSKIAQLILDKTPKETRDRVKELAKSRLNHSDEIGVLRISDDIPKEKLEEFKNLWFEEMARPFNSEQEVKIINFKIPEDKITTK